MRARQPDVQGVVGGRDGGVASAYDVFNQGGSPTVLLLPTWTITHAMHWKAQVPVLARHYRVITMDGRGNGRSARPADPAAYTHAAYAADVLAVLDEAGAGQAVVAGVSDGGALAAYLAANHPDRVLGAVMIAPGLGFLSPPHPYRVAHDFDEVLAEDAGWALFNEHAWRRDFPKFAGFFWRQVFTEPHSTKQIEDATAWTLETDGETLIATMQAPDELDTRDKTVALLERITCPTLLIHGTDDALMPPDRSEAVAGITGGDLLLVSGGGHCPQARDPVLVNHALREFIDRVTPPDQRAPRRRTWTRALSRPRRVLYLSSPIGLGHARRDLAIARELRAQRGDVQVDWLTQHPVTAFLQQAGESVHPAAVHLASESAHVEAEAHEHSLHAFQAVRRMDEILVSNFSVFQDIVDTGDYDLVVGDEAWDADYFWHENPELKRTAFVWMTDFVGWLPMPEGGTGEAALTADYNAEMLEHVARFARVRDRSVFVGDPADVVPDTFGPGLPSIRDWTSAHYDFAGYITGFDPAALGDRDSLRRELGYPADEPVVVVTVGGSGVGADLLSKVIGAYPAARKQIDGLRLLVVAGPRIDPSQWPGHDGIDVRGYVPDLHRHLAACDGAIIQGGLTTAMELVATGRPFLYFPLGNHFEQQRHVRHRLDRHRAGRFMSYADADADAIADALADELARPVAYEPVPSDGARRAAALIAELL
jgi:pimeloyl-ACP methyl ester carboxylesterase/predicted glycosyltransferase